MSRATDEELPPLGEPTPANQPSAAARRRHVVIAACLAFLAGLATGAALASLLDDDGVSEAVAPPAGNSSNTAAPPTTVESLPEECVATLRSAQQTLVLLDQGLRDLRTLNLSEVDRAAREVDQLRGRLDADGRRCLELIGD